MYSSGFWIRSADAKRLGKCVFSFLARYALLADATLRLHKQRFPVTPKLHMLAHTGHDLLEQSSISEWCINPACFTNQAQEDYIGRPSRLSRRVNVRNMATSVVRRSLIQYQMALEKSDLDGRGMDAYHGL